MDVVFVAVILNIPVIGVLKYHFLVRLTEGQDELCLKRRRKPKL